MLISSNEKKKKKYGIIIYFQMNKKNIYFSWVAKNADKVHGDTKMKDYDWTKIKYK